MTSKLPPLVSVVMAAVSKKHAIEETTFAELLTLELAGEPVFLALETIGNGIALQAYRNYMVTTATQMTLVYNTTKSKVLHDQIEAIKTTKTWRYKKVENVATLYPADIATNASKSFVANLLKGVSPGNQSQVERQIPIPEVTVPEKKGVPSDTVRLVSLRDDAFDEDGVFIGGRGYRALESPIGYFFQLLNERHTALLWAEFSQKG